jgi:hypothetical protein
MLAIPKITCCFKTRDNVINFIHHEAFRPHAREFNSVNVLEKGHAILEDNGLMVLACVFVILDIRISIQIYSSHEGQLLHHRERITHSKTMPKTHIKIYTVWKPSIMIIKMSILPAHFSVFSSTQLVNKMSGK